jgi:hypothetical protein
MQTRSRAGPKSKRIARSHEDFSVPQIDNTSRDGGSDVVPATVGKSLLARGPEVLWDKTGRAGRLEVMREVIYDMISTLRVDGVHER